MIITNEEQLRVVSEDATLEESLEIIPKLEKELKQSGLNGFPGIGLSAIQIGIPKRVAIVRLNHNGNLISLNLVNAKIKNKYDLQVVQEGCLSFPDRYEKVKRYNEIYVVDNLVGPHSFIGIGLLSQCCAHELNHWDGIVLPDFAIN